MNVWDWILGVEPECVGARCGDVPAALVHRVPPPAERSEEPTSPSPPDAFRSSVVREQVHGNAGWRIDTVERRHTWGSDISATCWKRAATSSGEGPGARCLAASASWARRFLRARAWAHSTDPSQWQCSAHSLHCLAGWSQTWPRQHPSRWINRGQVIGQEANYGAPSSSTFRR